MREIIKALPSIKKKILTSATQKAEIPNFIGIKRPEKLNYLSDIKIKLKLKTIVSPTQDKLETLEHLVRHVGNSSGIVFCNLYHRFK